jgi:hypothetical protein
MNESRKKKFLWDIDLTLCVFIFLFCTPVNLSADVGSTYKCKMVENLGITDGNLSKLEKYELQEFSFTREKKKIKFGKADNYFQGAEYEVTKSFEKMFLARSDQGQIAYNVQNFYYTLTSYANVIFITGEM